MIGIKRDSISRRLFWFGGAFLAMVVWGSQSEASPSSSHLREEKHRNTRAVNGLDGYIHHAGTIQLQEIAEATTPTSIYGKNVRYHSTIESPVYLETETPIMSPLTPAPTTEMTPELTFSPESTVNDIPTTLNPTMVTSNPTVGTLSPTMTTFDPTIGTLSPTITTSNPTVGTLSPTITTFDPTTVTLNPTTNTDSPTVTPPDTAVLSYQNVAGLCGGESNGIGCANDSPDDASSGNPNDIVNCYDVTLFGVEPPFTLDSIRVWIGDSTTLTPDLRVQVWVGNPGGGPISERLLYSEELFDYSVGENKFDLNMVGLLQTNICVGVTALSANAGLRIQTDNGGAGEASFLRSPECGLDEFISLFDVGLTNDFCIEALVRYGDALVFGT